jgi:hypothetical protein
MRFVICVGEWTHHDGSKYVGDWQQGKEHGQGTLVKCQQILILIYSLILS